MWYVLGVILLVAGVGVISKRRANAKKNPGNQSKNKNLVNGIAKIPSAMRRTVKNQDDGINEVFSENLYGQSKKNNQTPSR